MLLPKQHENANVLSMNQQVHLSGGNTWYKIPIGKNHQDSLTQNKNPE